MANEISVLASLQCVNGTFRVGKNPGIVRADQATSGGGQPGTFSVTTTDTAITISNLTTPRWAYLQNIGTNAVDVGPTSGGAIVKVMTLKAGEVALLPLAASVALRCQTTTGTSKL